MSARPREVCVALLTPYGEDGAPDLRALAAHVELLVEDGVDAVMPCGTNGEGPLLADGEVVAIVEAVVAAAAGRVRVLAHVGRPGTANTIELAQRTLAAGADAVSAIVPYYYSLSDEQVLEHFRALLRALRGRRVYAYTLPARTGNELSIEVVRALAADGIAGVKDSTKSLEQHLAYLATGVDVLIGTDALVHEAFAAGAAGCISAIANVRPDLLCALRDGGGAEVQRELSALRTELPFPRLKDAVAKRVRDYPTAYRAPL